MLNPFPKQLPSLTAFFCNVKPLLQAASLPRCLFPQYSTPFPAVVFFLGTCLHNVKPFNLKEPLSTKGKGPVENQMHWAEQLGMKLVSCRVNDEKPASPPPFVTFWCQVGHYNP